MTRPRRISAIAFGLLSLSATIGLAQSNGSSAARVSAAQSAGTVAITAAIVLVDMTVRPLPEFGLDLVADDDTSRVMGVRTGLDGRSSLNVPYGQYHVRSERPVTLNDSTYEWNVPVRVDAPAVGVEITNANAKATAAAVVVARQIAPERQVFEQARRSVFRVEAGLGHGSGFLAKLPGTDVGLVVTDDHVVANDTIASVYLDSVTRVPAVVVARDRDADIALLRLPAARCGDCLLLPLASPKAGEPLVVPGERLLALGFPLHQQLTLTTGIVSSVPSDAIISDVNINHGNSGGPLLNLAGEVVGINAFGDFSEQGGPGISGAIAITKIAKLRTQVAHAVDSVPPPPDSTLPYMPVTAYPLEALKAAADTVNPKSYRRLFQRDADHFVLNITTPVVYRVQQRMFENEVGQERKKREQRSGISKDQAYSETKQSHDWEQYVGESTTPVVAITVSPKIGETTGSAIARGLSGIRGEFMQGSYVFQGDVRGAHFYRNGVEIEPIFGGHGPVVEDVETALVKLKDVADYGYLVLPPELLMPDSTGAPARVRVAIKDLQRPNETSGTEISGELSARVWNDFRGYYAAVHPERPFVLADPSLKSPAVKMDCAAGACHVAP